MRKLAFATFAVAASFACCLGADAAQYPTKPYDATYEIVQPIGGTTTSHTMTDGKGHMRSETVSAGTKTVMLMDYPKSQMLTLMETQKMAMKAKLPPNSYVDNTDKEMQTKNHAKDLGSKTIEGHPCHGWGYSNAAGSVEVWVGTDIGVPVLSTTGLPGGKKSVQTLKSYSGNAPAAALFSMDVPAGYKVMGSY